MADLLDGYVPTYRPAKPGKVVKLNPAFERAVRGPVRKPQAIAEIEATASLIYSVSTAPTLAEMAGRGRG
jgi:hypothetical protein